LVSTFDASDGEGDGEGGGHGFNQVASSEMRKLMFPSHAAQG